MLCNISTMTWDDELCALLGVPRDMLPEIRKSSDDYGEVTAIEAIRGVPVCGVAGDQQAALFGQNCTAPGQIKNTYGTGCFAVLNTGSAYIRSRQGLLSTLAATPAGILVMRSGSIFIAGAAAVAPGRAGDHTTRPNGRNGPSDDNAGVILFRLLWDSSTALGHGCLGTPSVLPGSKQESSCQGRA